MAKSLPELLLAAAAADPERPFLRFAGRTLSRAQVADAVVRTAGWLTRKGLAGHRVALLLENRPEFLEAWLRARLARAGAGAAAPGLRADRLSTRRRGGPPRAR